MFRVAIPARHASTRLPGKPLAMLAGEPMILHVHRQASRSGAVEVVVATDDERIRSVCAAAGIDVEMTGPELPSGTDRLAALAARRGWADDSIVVNLQGDEPLMPPALIDQVAALLAGDETAAIATLATSIASRAEFMDPNVVKVVSRTGGQALYFSRAPIPCHRDPADGAAATSHAEARRHLGIYAYRVAALRRVAALPPSPLELHERLEQLRALQAGMTILVADAVEPPGPGVDTAADLARVEALWRSGRGS
ncbi:MAG: 3-deoxy-manno-octulosonate cytidylyltransferase [Steroidobacteraceae bacterium]